MKFSDRLTHAETAWGRWLDMHAPSWSEHLTQDQSIKTAFEAGIHLGIAIGEKEAQHDRARFHY